MTSHIEDLGGRRVTVTDAYTFGTDALLLADFAEAKPHERVCDLGTGCGILPLLLNRVDPAPMIDAVEIQPEAVTLARYNVEANGLSDRITVYEQDWRSLSLPVGAYDRVLCNPPYFAENSGKSSPDLARRIARCEQGDTLRDVATAAARLLRNGGHFILCHRPERLADVISVLRATKLEPKRLQLVHTRESLSPFLLLCDAVLGAKPSLRVLPPLILESKVSLCPEH